MVVETFVLSAVFPNGAVESYAYVFKTKGAGLWLQDLANLARPPLRSTNLSDLRVAYASEKPYATAISPGTQAVLAGKARTRVDRCF